MKTLLILLQLLATTAWATNFTQVRQFNIGATLYVMTNGNDSSAMRDRLDLPWASIIGASTNAAAGDEIQVGPGSYLGVVTLGTNVSLVGRGQYLTQIYGNTNAATPVLTTTQSNRVYGLSVLSTNGVCPVIGVGDQCRLKSIYLSGNSNVVVNSVSGLPTASQTNYIISSFVIGNSNGIVTISSNVFLVFDDCYVSSVNPNPQGGTGLNEGQIVRQLGTRNGAGMIDWRNCWIWSGHTNAKAAFQPSTTSVAPAIVATNRFFGCRIQTAGGNLFSSATTCIVDPATTYDPSKNGTAPGRVGAEALYDLWASSTNAYTNTAGYVASNRGVVSNLTIGIGSISNESPIIFNMDWVKITNGTYGAYPPNSIQWNWSRDNVTNIAFQFGLNDFTTDGQPEPYIWFPGVTDVFRIATNGAVILGNGIGSAVNNGTRLTIMARTNTSTAFPALHAVYIQYESNKDVFVLEPTAGNRANVRLVGTSTLNFDLFDLISGNLGTNTAAIGRSNPSVSFNTTRWTNANRQAFVRVRLSETPTLTGPTSVALINLTVPDTNRWTLGGGVAAVESNSLYMWFGPNEVGVVTNETGNCTLVEFHVDGL